MEQIRRQREKEAAAKDRVANASSGVDVDGDPVSDWSRGTALSASATNAQNQAPVDGSQQQPKFRRGMQEQPRDDDTGFSRSNFSNRPPKEEAKAPAPASSGPWRSQQSQQPKTDDGGSWTKSGPTRRDDGGGFQRGGPRGEGTGGPRRDDAGGFARSAPKKEEGGSGFGGFRNSGKPQQKKDDDGAGFAGFRKK